MFIGRSLPLLVLLLCSFVFAQPATQPADALIVERALSQIQSGDWILQWQAMNDLARLKARQGVVPLGTIITSNAGPFVRSRALVALATIDPAAALPHAQTLAASNDVALRQGAIEALGLIAAPAARQVIIDHLADPISAIRCQAVIAYARLDRAAAFERIDKILQGGDWEMMFAAVHAMALVGTDQSWDRLLASLNDKKNGDLRRAAAAALGESGDPRAIAALLARIAIEKERSTIQACQKSLSFFPAAQLATPLLNALDGDQTAVYGPALALLVVTPTKVVCDRIAARLDAFDKADAKVLPLAFRLLSRCDSASYGLAITRYADHTTLEVRRAAIDALGQSQAADVDPFAVLRDRLLDTDKQVRASAYQSLRRTTQAVPKGGIVPYLAKPLASSVRADYWPAVELLRERMTRADLPAALAALDHLLAGADAESRRLIAAVLEPHADQAALEQITRAQGYPSQWLMVGPFLNDPSANGAADTDSKPPVAAIDIPYPPERQVDPKETFPVGPNRQLKWAIAQNTRTDGIVDLSYIYAEEVPAKARPIAYGAVKLRADGDGPIVFSIAAKGGWAMWLNGQKLANGKDEQLVKASLTKGDNLLLVKVAGVHDGQWQFRLRLTDSAGKRPPAVTSELP